MATVPARSQTRRETRRGLHMGRVRGIPIRVHWTLLLALPFFAWLMATLYFGTEPEGWAWGAALAVTLFASVTIHELAHSLVALSRGVSIREILLMPIGGVSVMEHPSREPRDELLITFVGPLASLVLGGAAVGAAYALGIPLVLPRELPPASAFLVLVGYLNLTLGLFNLLVPAFPMDGGRILRAALASKLGFLKATRIAAAVGRGFALLMGAVGVFGGSIFLVVIAVFVWMGARAEEQGALVSTTLEGVTLEEIMTSAPATVAGDATVDEALQTMLESKHLALPVTRDGRPVGLLTTEMLARVPAAERASTRVADVAAGEIRTMPPQKDAAEVMNDVVQAGLVAVIDGAGRLLGVVTPTDVLRVVQIRATAARG